MIESHAMQRALELAQRGWGRVHPNPLVGAVVLSEGAIVAEGYHGEFGGPHAEAVALAAAGERARGATLITTVEPCAAAAKQPSCADLVLASGIRRVVIGMPDPNPAKAGGAARLTGAGLEVEIGPAREEVERQNGAFLHRVAGTGRPFVTIKLATSLDHRIADSAGHSRWISGDEARDWVHWFRAGFGAIGVGGRTAQIDDPMLTARGAVEPRVPPTRVIFAGHRRVSLDATVVRTAREVPTVVVSADPVAAEAAALTERGVAVITAPDLGSAMAALGARGIDSIVIEGGGRLAGALLAADLVDQLAWIVSPLWLGDHGVPAVRGLEVPSLLQAERWVIAERRALGQDTLLRFDRR